jgi:hypothetical protein
MIPGDVENLTAINPGEEFEVVRTLLNDVGQDQGFVPGRRWRCRYNGSAVMLLVSDTGQTVSVPCDVARYIEVNRTRGHSPGVR